jgi:hypothetical protein
MSKDLGSPERRPRFRHLPCLALSGGAASLPLSTGMKTRSSDYLWSLVREHVNSRLDRTKPTRPIVPTDRPPQPRGPIRNIGSGLRRYRAPDGLGPRPDRGLLDPAGSPTTGKVVAGGKRMPITCQTRTAPEGPFRAQEVEATTDRTGESRFLPACPQGPLIHRYTTFTHDRSSDRLQGCRAPCYQRATEPRSARTGWRVTRDRESERRAGPGEGCTRRRGRGRRAHVDRDALVEPKLG